jgi:hypothetical protein
MFFITLLSLLLTAIAWANQVGTTSLPLSSTQRLGMEVGGYVNRGAGTSALMRFLHQKDETGFEFGAGGATGNHGARALASVRQQLVAEESEFPALYLRGGIEFYGDENAQRRTGIGGGPLLNQGFALKGQEVYAFLHPTARLGIDSGSNEYVWMTEASLGLNTRLDAEWIGSLEFNAGLQNAASAVTLGLAMDI